MDSFKQNGIFGEMFGDKEGSISKNILDIYRLEDADSTEITLEQLGERYFSDPDTCFIEDYDKRAGINGNDYTTMVLLNSILPKNNFKNSIPFVAEDSAEHFEEMG
jgi:hypothetical protein